MQESQSQEPLARLWCQYTIESNFCVIREGILIAHEMPDALM